MGVVPQAPTIYEVLEELAITVQNQLSSALPFCAFNGGNDVFVDVGNKSLGLEALMAYLGFGPAEVRRRVPPGWPAGGKAGKAGAGAARHHLRTARAALPDPLPPRRAPRPPRWICR